MAQYEFVGTVKKIGEEQTFPSGFSKRELVVTSEEDRYPQDVMFEFHKEKAGLLDAVNEADRVKVTFDITGREYQGRYFNNLKGWRLEKMDGSEGAAPSPQMADAVPPRPEMPQDVADVGDDNLPF